LLKSFNYRYEVNGLDEDGEKIPDIPVVYLVLETKRGRARGPAVLDTGFDGGIYPNIQVVRILEGLKPVKIKRIENPLYEPVVCEIFKVKASLVHPKLDHTIPLGEVSVYVPVEPEYLSDEVLVGREIINKLKLKLNGTWVNVEFPEV